MKSISALMLALLLYTGSHGQSAPKTPPSRPFVLGVIDEIRSSVLGESRTLNIYLPEGYAANDTERYPVIYLLDGSADEDFIHVAGLVQFNNFPWVNRLPKSIVVGIASVDRRRDFTFPTSVAADKKAWPTTGGSARFIAFIAQELQPYIDRQYRTTGTRTIIGQSFGGLLATEILYTRPALFSKYIIISPSLWWDGGSLLSRRTDTLFRGSTLPDVYIGVGKEGLTPGPQPRVMEVDANLLADKIRKSGSKGLKVYFDYLPDEDHATIAHQAISNAFRALYPVGPHQ